MVKAAIVCWSPLLDQGISAASTSSRRRGREEEGEEEEEEEEEAEEEKEKEGEDHVVIRLEEIRLEQPISHDAVEVLHTFILCTDLDLCFCTPLHLHLPRSPRAPPSSHHIHPLHGPQSLLEPHHDDIYTSIPGFSAVGVITELGSGVLSHHIGQRVAYCTFPINLGSSRSRHIHGSLGPSHEVLGDNTPWEMGSEANIPTLHEDSKSVDLLHKLSSLGPNVRDLSIRTLRETSSDDDDDDDVSYTVTSLNVEKTLYNHGYGSTVALEPREVSDMYRDLLPQAMEGSNVSMEGSNVSIKGSNVSTLPFPRIAQYYCSMAPSSAPFGAHCEARIVPVDHLIPLPDDIDDRTVATILFPGLIASTLVYEGKKRWMQQSSCLHIERDIIMKVLVYPAVGVLGSLVCQLAVHLGAFVIGAIPKGSVSGQEWSHRIVFMDSVDFSSNVQAQFGGNVSIVYDLTGKGPLQSCIDCLELGGIYISMERLMGTLHNEDHHSRISDERQLPGEKTLVKIHHADYVRNEKDLIQSAYELIELYRQKHVKCPIVNEYSLELAIQAHKDVLSQVELGGLGVCLLKPPAQDPENIPDLS